MKKEKRNPRSHELIREMIELYHPAVDKGHTGNAESGA